MHEASAALSFCVAAAAVFVGRSHGLGEALCSTGADSGVGNVEAVMAVVAADLGVVNEAESGVKGVLARGESSVRAGRVELSTGVLPDRSRVSDSCRVKCAVDGVDVGMTSGASIFGDNGCRSGSFWCCCPSSLHPPAGLGSGLSATACGLAEVMQSAR